MKEPLKTLSENIAVANDQFYQQNSTVDTVIGIMDKTLRKQGMHADAISVDCIPLNKKIVFLLHDAKPDQVDIAFGNKTGEINRTKQCDLNGLSVTDIVEYMTNYFS